MRKTQKIIWKLCYISAMVIVVLSFTPVLLEPEKVEPFVVGIPYHLWMSILFSIILVVLTVLGTFVHPGKREVDE